jgi:hypothetical protein
MHIPPSSPPGRKKKERKKTERQSRHETEENTALLQELDNRGYEKDASLIWPI